MPKRRRGDGGVAAETREAKLVGVLFPGEIFDGVVRGEIMAVEACAAGSTEAEVGGFGAAEGGGGGGGTVKAEFGGGEEGRRGGIVGRLRGRERRARLSDVNSHFLSPHFLSLKKLPNFISNGGL